jgi:hypothetical protein
MAKLKRELEQMVQRLRIKLAGSIALLVVVAVVGVTGVVAAQSGAFDWLAVQEDVANQIAESVVGENLGDEVLGAATSPLLPGPEFGVGDNLSFSVTSDFADATTTWYAPSPFRKATSTASEVVVETIATGKGLTITTTTVDLVRVTITSSTAAVTYHVGCGAGSNSGTTSTPVLLTSDLIAANTASTVIENDITSSEGAVFGGGQVRKIMLTPAKPYLVCKVVTSGNSGVFTNADSVTLGKVTARFNYTRH